MSLIANDLILLDGLFSFIWLGSTVYPLQKSGRAAYQLFYVSLWEYLSTPPHPLPGLAIHDSPAMLQWYITNYFSLCCSQLRYDMHQSAVNTISQERNVLESEGGVASQDLLQLLYPILANRADAGERKIIPFSITHQLSILTIIGDGITCRTRRSTHRPSIYQPAAKA